MGIDDKIEAPHGVPAGKVKEGAGKGIRQRGLQAGGKEDQAGANIKQTGEKIKGAFK